MSRARARRIRIHFRKMLMWSGARARPAVRRRFALGGVFDAERSHASRFRPSDVACSSMPGRVRSHAGYREAPTRLHRRRRLSPTRLRSRSPSLPTRNPSQKSFVPANPTPTTCVCPTRRCSRGKGASIRSAIEEDTGLRRTGRRRPASPQKLRNALPSPEPPDWASEAPSGGSPFDQDFEYAYYVQQMLGTHPAALATPPPSKVTAVVDHPVHDSEKRQRSRTREVEAVVGRARILDRASACVRCCSPTRCRRCRTRIPRDSVGCSSAIHIHQSTTSEDVNETSA